MSSISEIRHHIKVVSDTEKITSAMHLISSAKMKRAMALFEKNQTYVTTVRAALAYIVQNGGGAMFDSQYMRAGGHGRNAYVVLVGDKGLCGGYNNEILRLAQRVIDGDGGALPPAVYAVGHMAGEHFFRQEIEFNVEYVHIIHEPNLENAAELSQELCERFLLGEIDNVYVVYTHLIKAGVMEPMNIRALPMVTEDFMNVDPGVSLTAQPIFHPGAAQVFDRMIPGYITGLIYSALVQAYASEHYSRMTSMDAAVRNADEMLDDLKIRQNRARQGAITQEITEIIAGIPAQTRRVHGR